jgi:FkbM family methyltransferase
MTDQPYDPPEDIAGVHPRFYLPEGSDLAWWDSRGGAPESSLIDWAAQFLQKGDLFLDVGAHIGTWSITYALKGFWVIAFEAQHWLSEILNRNIKLNRVNVVNLGVALSDYQGTANLRAPFVDGGGGSIICDFPASSPINLEVQVTTLDSYDLTDVKMMKIDVEGSELDVLRGATATIAASQPVILFECWNDERGQRKEELFRYLHDTLNYKTTSCWPETWLAEPKG